MRNEDNSVKHSGFWSLIVTQFQGSFNDNAHKFIVIFLIAGMGLPIQQRDRLVLVVGALFSLPFILFSMAGGYLADRFSKRAVTIGTRAAEVLIMSVATAGLALKSVPVMLAAIFLVSSESAFFGPSKYGLLPELLPAERLSWGNGILELGTFLAIISGTVAGGILAEQFRQGLVWAGLILVGFSLMGLLTSLGIGRVSAADPTRRFRFNFVSDFACQVRRIRADRTLLLAVLGNTYFWFLGALLQFNIVFYAADVLKLSETDSGKLQAAVAIGIGIGSFVAGYLSGHKIEYGFIPLGSIGLSVFGFALSISTLSFTSFAVYLSLLGFASGFFVVPINALIQRRPEADKKGAIIGAANLLSFVGIFLASGAYYMMKAVAHLDPSQVFLASAVLTLGATFYVLVLMPDALLRLLLWAVVHSIYRIRVAGRENIPEKGGALLVCNHLSFIDALLLMASTERRIRFLMYKGYYDRAFIKLFARMIDTIPISSEQRPRELVRSLREASNAIRQGDVVCIFAEGQMTRIGQLLPFRRGMERIMDGIDAPIIPVHLDGVWGSIFSYEKKRFFWKMPRRLFEVITISYGASMPGASTAFEVREAVQRLHTDAYSSRANRMRTLPQMFIRTACKHPFRFAMADTRVPGGLRFFSALTRTILLARRLKKVWEGQRMVGILLPPSVAGSLVNFAALALGKIPVNLNYTLSAEGLASCATQAELQTVVTSKALLERVPVQVPGRTVFVEELAADPGFGERVLAPLMALMLPSCLLERFLRGNSKLQKDDIATIIFSSGSTGDPKGVMLTHFNIGSNIEQLGQVFALGPKDKLLGVLPFFHSFGFTGTFALPLALGVGVVYHANPLDARTVGVLVMEYGVTFLLATPTFLEVYIRHCTPEQFGSLDLVLVGAEKLQGRTAQAFEDKFGIRPLEAYGCTECSPAVTVSTRDFRAAGYRQIGAKRGKIGHALPGVSVRIVHPETFEPRPVGESGLLLIRGPNVMKGYLNLPGKTAEVLRNGWYVTGDIATVDEDGFLEITDRLSRFSKIGGEMVPHIKIEERLQEMAGLAEQSFAVTGIPDSKKGERLVVLHTLPEERLKECLEKLGKTDLPNLWMPRPTAFFRVQSLPHLGSGKLDLRKIHERALEEMITEDR